MSSKEAHSPNAVIRWSVSRHTLQSRLQPWWHQRKCRRPVNR